MSQAKPPFIASPPPTSSQVATADFPHGEGKCASCRRQGNLPWRLASLMGEGGMICGLITDYRIGPKFNMKMDNDVLLLCYLDKIRLTLTGNLWRALVSLYSEGRLYKGARTATHSQSTTLHSTGNTSV
jgi:hypothetical protein